jgi:hypothetical protein
VKIIRIFCLRIFFVTPLLVIASSFLFGQNFFLEDFDNLDQWKPLHFNKIDRWSQYSIIENENSNVLMAISDSSASGLIWKNTFNPFETPEIEWSWKIENILEKGNARKKSGDDYALRIYIIFEYDAKRAGFLESIMYESLKLLYGEYPPMSSLNYIWANKNHKVNFLSNPFTEKAQMFIVESGNENANKWLIEQVNILKDYRLAFGEDPPKKASLAIMTDTDNTGEKSKAYIDYIKIK